MCNTGWISEIWKEVQAKILKESFVLVKQTIPQQEALDLSFIFGTLKVGVALPWGCHALLP